MSAHNEAIRDFKTSLNELKNSSKPVIAMLTILADENQHIAPDIASAIEQRLREAISSEKLPVLYLIDSIVKTLANSPYRELFANNISSNFVATFQVVDEKTKGAMYKLRQTWADIFPMKKLYVIDVKVNQLDRNWPIIPLPSDPLTGTVGPPIPPLFEPSSSSSRQTNSIAAGRNGISADATPAAIAAKVQELQLLTEKHKILRMERQREESLQTDTKIKDFEQQMLSMAEKLQTSSFSASTREALEPLLSNVVGALKLPPTAATSPPLRQPGSEPVIVPDVMSEENSPHDPRLLDSRKRPIQGPDEKSKRSGTKRRSVRKEEGDLARRVLLKGIDGEDETGYLSQHDESSMASSSGDAMDIEKPDEAVDTASNSPRDMQLPSSRIPMVLPPPLFAPMVPSDVQSLEPVQPLKPPGSASVLPPGPVKMPATESTGDEQADQVKRLIDEAESQLQSGLLTDAQHSKLTGQMQKLIEIHQRILENLKSMVRRHTSGGTTDLLGGMPGSTQEDARQSNILQPASFPPTPHVVLNGEIIEMTIGGPPRTVHFAGKRRVLRINQQSRQILVDGNPVYKLNSSLREITLDGCRVTIFYHGAMQSIWFDSIEYQLRLDAPPQTIVIDGQQIEIVIDMVAGQIFIDCEPVCRVSNMPCDVILPRSGRRHRVSFHAPARQIHINGQLCEVKLDLHVPAVLINGELRGIRFDDEPRVCLVDDEPYHIPVDSSTPVKFGDQTLPVQLGAPAQELIIGSNRYNVGFGAGHVFLMVNGNKHKVELPGVTPEVKLLGMLDPATGQVLSPSPLPSIPPPPFALPPMPPYGAPPFGGPPPPMDFMQWFPMSQMVPQPVMHSSSYAQPEVVVETSFPTPAPAPAPPPVSVQPPQLPPPPPAPDVNELLSKLVKAGILSASAAAAQAASATIDLREEKVEGSAPILTDFNIDLLKGKYPAELMRLYGGVQCGSCGCRFSSPDAPRYRLHLDWHFRVNRREREAVRVMRHRAWYLPVMDWISLEQSADPDKPLGVQESQTTVNVGEAGSGGRSTNADDGLQLPEKPDVLEASMAGGDGNGGDIVSCPAASENQRDTCVVCGEGFEQFWHEEHDEWHLKDAICVSNRIFHTVCYEDAARTGTLTTPAATPTVTAAPSLNFLATPSSTSANKLHVSNNNGDVVRQNGGGNSPKSDCPYLAVKSEPTNSSDNSMTVDAAKQQTPTTS